MCPSVLSIQGYNRHFCNAFEQTLSSLGENPKKAIYRHLEETFQIRRWEIPGKIDIIEKFFDQIFGAGAVSLKNLFYKNLNNAIGNVCIIVPLSQFFYTIAEYNKQNKITTNPKNA